MMKTLLRASALVLFPTLLTPAAHAQPGGTTVHLLAVPAYVQRLFLPVVPNEPNRLSVAALPAESVLSAPPGFDVTIENGAVVARSGRTDASGYARVKAGGRELTLSLASVLPYSELQNGTLGGYRIGDYKAQPLKGLASYERPRGFIRLQSANASLQVADHYVLSDFQCKLDGDTKYLVLRTEALLKLEILQHELEASEGLKFSRFSVMSGYRTPYYNAKIGNETSSSRHLYGDAMDIFVDTNHDGAMDDVNGDGRIDAGDARTILRVATRIDQSPEWGWLKGGAGVYEANAAHGPYVHVDARGYVARWGLVNEPAAKRASMRSLSAR
jgi:hypothetical protein